MSEAETLFAALRQSSDEAVVDMLERMVRDAQDHALNKMNALDLAGTAGIDEESHRSPPECGGGLGMFEMTWNVMCPSCAGVLSANKSLKTLDRAGSPTRWRSTRFPERKRSNIFFGEEP